MAALGWMTAYAAAILICISARAYVLTTLWAWFVVPGFGLPQVSAYTAMGLSVIISLLTFQTPPDVETKKRSSAETFAIFFLTSLMVSVFSLLAGWLYKVIL